MTIKINIAGATGYTGLELIRLLVNHPEVEINKLTSETYSGKSISEVFPSLAGRMDKKLEPLDESIAKSCDVLFLALPHTTAMDKVPGYLGDNCRVIDLSADYRLKDAEVFGTWYKTPHTHPEIISKAVYGLPELHREKIKSAELVANPGCYPTSAILGLAPLAQADGVNLDSIIIDSKSGLSGAGRKANLTTQFCESNEGVSAYGLAEHRHTPEIEQELTGLAGKDIRVSFSPHLIPMTRGLLSTIYIDLAKEMDVKALADLYRNFYKGEPFVRILPVGKFASTQPVKSSNYCDIGVQVDKRNRRAIITSAIDNLVKGASGQAVQNMNLMLGFDEATALNNPAVFP